MPSKGKRETSSLQPISIRAAYVTRGGAIIAAIIAAIALVASRTPLFDGESGHAEKAIRIAVEIPNESSALGVQTNSTRSKAISSKATTALTNNPPAPSKARSLKIGHAVARVQSDKNAYAAAGGVPTANQGPLIENSTIDRSIVTQSITGSVTQNN